VIGRALGAVVAFALAVVIAAAVGVIFPVGAILLAIDGLSRMP
jgi:hypothetical protein